MNIFVTDISPTTSAINLDDKRVRHMPKESMEMLAIFLHRITGIWVIKFPYWEPRTTDIRELYDHPCCKWVQKDLANMTWLRDHLMALHHENLFRFGEFTVGEIYYRKVIDATAEFAIDRKPEKFRNSSLFKNEKDIIKAYRETMKVKWFQTDKVKPVIWTKRDKPIWLLEEKQLTLI